MAAVRIRTALAVGMTCSRAIAVVCIEERSLGRDHPEAAALYEPAIPVLEQAHVTRNEFTIWVIHFGQAALALHQPTRALPTLERLATRFDDLRPDLRVAAEFTLARTLWDTGGDRRQAHELASHALAAVGPQGTTPPDDVRQIARWLARH